MSASRLSTLHLTLLSASLSLLLLQLLHQPPPSGSLSIAEACGGECNFTWLDGQLARTLHDGQRVDAASFASSLVALNLRLRPQLREASKCARRWLNRPAGNCYGMCCPDPGLAGLLSALGRIKADVKLSFTAMSRQASASSRLAAYQAVAFDILNVFSGAFVDFVLQLAQDSDQAKTELLTFAVFYEKLQREQSLGAVLGLCSSNASLLMEAARAADCDRLRPLGRNAHGVALQYLAMSELASTGTAQVAWQTYLATTECVSQAMIACDRAAASAGRGSRGSGYVGAGGASTSDDDDGPSGSSVALAVLIPALLLLLVVVIVVAVRQRRALQHQLRALQRDQQQQLGQNHHDDNSGSAEQRPGADRDEADSGNHLAAVDPSSTEHRGAGSRTELQRESAAAMVAGEFYSDDPDEV